MVIVHILSSLLNGGVASVVNQLIIEQINNGNTVVVVSCDSEIDVQEKIKSSKLTFFRCS